MVNMKKDKSVRQAQDKTYVLGMFPYPSGEGLHVGHVRIYTAVDVMARYFRMKGQEVLHPVGWDAFGLPAENAAIKAKKNPKEMVPKNEANFKRQMEDLSLDFDWERTFSTTDPRYYAITQWIFLQLYNKKDENGQRLVYREKVAINWCPKCKTGLANEEVLADGTHERCGNQVEKKLLPQWVMRITSYADRLLEDLDVDLNIEGVRLDKERKGLDWPRGILEMQRNWIGKKKGVRVKFEMEDFEYANELEVFTTRLDTIFGVTYMSVSPEIVKGWIDEGWKASESVSEYVNKSLAKTEQMRLEEAGEKTGIDTGLKAVNPVNGEEVPVWVADYVLSGVGTGVVMGVPAHDGRDYEFAKKYGLEIREVVVPMQSGSSQSPEMIRDDSPVLNSVADESRAYIEDGKLVNSGEFDGLSSEEARGKILEELKSKDLAEKETTYHLRDWVFSRQRYWGEPIPLVYCQSCAENHPDEFEIVEVPVRSGSPHSPDSTENDSPDLKSVSDESSALMKVAVVSVPESELPLELPKLKAYEPTDTGESPLSRVEDWVNVKCPSCGSEAKRETDTMPNWAGSCWYFLAYPFWAVKQEGKEIKNLNDAKEKIASWMPVDWYLGGAEHAVLHLLYARFWVKVLQDLGIVDFPEPFLRLRSVGMVLAEDGKKMSKSIGNVINPDDMVKEFGSDEVRLYEMFMGPWDQSIAWDTRALVGQRRFLDRIKGTFGNKKNIGESTSPVLIRELHDLLYRVERGISEQKFNTSIAGMMEYVNTLRDEKIVTTHEHGLMFAQILSPFAPIAAQELWVNLGGEGEVHESDWPSLDIEVSDEVEVSIVVQVNGKVRVIIKMSKSESESEEKVVEAAMENERVKKWIESEPKKTIFVKGKLVNFVV